MRNERLTRTPARLAFALAAVVALAMSAHAAVPGPADERTADGRDFEEPRTAAPTSWLYLYRNVDGRHSLLGSLIEYDSKTGDFSLLPLIRWRGNDLTILWPVFHWSPDRKRVLPVSWGRDTVAGADGGPGDPDCAATTATHYFSIFPLLFQRWTAGTPNRQTLFLTSYHSRIGQTRSWGVLPLFGVRREGQSDMTLAILNFLMKRKGDSHFAGILPLAWCGRNADAEEGAPDRYYGVLPFAWGTTDRSLSHFMVLPLFWKTPKDWALFPVLWGFERGFAVFPLYGQGIKRPRPLPGETPDERARREAGEDDVRWRFVLWPLYASSSGKTFSRTAFLGPLIGYSDESDGSLERHLWPLGSYRKTAVIIYDRAPVGVGWNRTLTLLPLLAMFDSSSGRLGQVDENGKLIQETDGAVRRTENQALLLYRSGSSFIRSVSGEVLEDKCFSVFFPLYDRVDDRVRHRRSRSYLLKLFDTHRSGDTNGWGVGWFLARYKKTPKQKRFNVVWRLFEYSKDDQGTKRLRLLFSPAFRVAGPRPAEEDTAQE